MSLNMEPSKEILDITPDTRYIDAVSNSQLGCRRAFAELIDNSFDAGASFVSIDYGKQCITITDDGCGIGDLKNAVRLGSHKAHAKTALGRYGVGLKDAALYFRGILEIASSCKGKVRDLCIDWDRLSGGGKWEAEAHINDATAERCAALGVSTKQGTRITFRNSQKKLDSLPVLVDDLSYTFSPAIESGRQITFTRNGQRYTIPAYKLPELDHATTREDEVNGKRFRVYAGVVPDGQPNPKPGYTIAYKHRVIIDGTSNGCGHYASAHFFAWVELIGDWKLSRNKDGIVEDYEALTERLLSLCQEQLRASSTQTTSVELAGIQSDLSNILNEVFAANVKEKRAGKQNEAGAAVAKDTGRQRQRAERIQDGTRSLVTLRGTRIAVEFVNLGHDREHGRAELHASGPRICLNLAHSMIDQARQQNNRPLLAMTAGTLLATFAIAQSPEVQQKLLPGIAEGNFADRFTQAIALYTKHIAPRAADESKTLEALSA